MAERPLDSGTGTGHLASAGAPTTVASLVDEISARLSVCGVRSPLQEARDLLAALVDEPRFWSVLHADSAPAPELVDRARAAAERRALGAPLAYATGLAPFRHLTLEVDERVLIPRQETELLPGIVMEHVNVAGGLAVDVGTGSGAIALALAAEGDFDRVMGTDLSAQAVAVARRNGQRLRAELLVPVEFRVGSGLAPVMAERARVVVSNPPYIAYHELAALPKSVRDWEPAWALSCAREGLSVTTAIIRDAVRVLEPGGLLALEVDVRRAGTVAELVATNGAYTDVNVKLDLTGRERFVVATREG